MLNTQGPFLNGGNKTAVFLPRRVGVDFVNDLMTILLSVEADLIHLLL